MRSSAPAVLAFLLAACGSQPSMNFPDDVTIAVGRPFPDLILPALDDGRPRSISELHGKKTMIHVFASW
jgi:hypothetical protein